MFTPQENCWRMELAESDEDARAYVGSRSTTVTRAAPSRHSQ